MKRQFFNFSIKIKKKQKREKSDNFKLKNLTLLCMIQFVIKLLTY